MIKIAGSAAPQAEQYISRSRAQIEGILKLINSDCADIVMILVVMAMREMVKLIGVTATKRSISSEKRREISSQISLCHFPDKVHGLVELISTIHTTSLYPNLAYQKAKTGRHDTKNLSTNPTRTKRRYRRDGYGARMSCDAEHLDYEEYKAGEKALLPMNFFIPAQCLCCPRIPGRQEIKATKRAQERYGHAKPVNRNVPGAAR